MNNQEDEQVLILLPGTMTTNIQFGDYTAELRDDGNYYLRYPNGGGAMAMVAGIALINELAKCREYSSWLQGECDKAVETLYSRNREIADAMAALRSGYIKRADGEGASTPWRAATDLARQELDAVITKLGLAPGKDGVNG